MNHCRNIYHILSLLLLSTLIGACTSENEGKTVDPNYEKIGYYGKVKSVKSTLYYMNKDSVWASQSDYNFKEFDQEGRLTSEGIRSNNNITRSKCQYQYDENGKRSGYSFSQQLGGSYNGTYKYDPETGLLMEELCMSRKTNDNFDAKSDEKLAHEESVSKKETYVYDSKNNLVEKHCYQNQDKKPSYQKYAYAYDEQNRVIEEITFIKESKTEPDSKKSYKYDSKGRVIEEIEERLLSKLDSSPEKVRISRRYDRKGNIVEETREEKGQRHTTSYTYTYKAGKIIEETRITSEGEKRITEHEDNGNTTVTNYENGKVVMKAITKRDKYGNLEEIMEYHLNESNGKLEPQYLLLYEIEYYE
ncbi:MAG: hypothetical protein Q3998_05320 [Porphyromonas sp.]|nr:hypothetical protein [Porphyromonas sp.]